MLNLICAAIISIQDPLAVKLGKVTVVARPLHEIAKSMGETAGATLLVPGKTGDEIAFLNLKDPTLKDGMDALASLVYGEWKLENGVYSLVRITAAEVEQRAAERDIAALQTKIKAVADSLRQPAWTQESLKKYVDDQYKLQQSLVTNMNLPSTARFKIHSSGTSATGPVQQLLSGVIGSLDARLLYAIPPGSRRVWSTRPNRMQQRMQFNISDAVQVYGRQLMDIYDELHRNPRQDLGAEFSGSLGFPNSRQLDLDKVNVIVARSFERRYQVGIQLIGRNGEELANHSCHLMVQLATEQPVTQSPAQTEPKPEVEIPVGAVSKEFFGYVAGSGMYGSSVRAFAVRVDDRNLLLRSGNAVRSFSPSPTISAVLSDPTKADPLSLILPDILSGLFGTRDYAALVPDMTWEQLSFFVARPMFKSQVLQTIGYECETVSNGELSIMRPVQPLRTERERASRSAMRDFISTSNARGFARLSEISQYVVQRSNPPSSFKIDMMILGLATPFAAKEMADYFGFNYWSAAVLAGGKFQLDKLPTGESFWTLENMSREQRFAMERLLLDAHQNTTLDGGRNLTVGENSALPTVTMAAHTEPTERYPNGLPATIAVRLTTTEENGLVGKVRSNRNGKLMGVYDLGAVLGMIDGSGGANGDFKITEFEEFDLAKVKFISLALMEQNVENFKIFQGTQFLDGGAMPGSSLKLNQLPEDMLKTLARVRNQVRDVVHQNFGRGPAKPPPP